MPAPPQLVDQALRGDQLAAMQDRVLGALEVVEDDARWRRGRPWPGPFDLNAAGSFVPAGSPSIRSDATQPTGAVPTIVPVTPRDGGFDWGDAGIGAAGGLAISLVGIGGALAISQNRRRRTAP